MTSRWYIITGSASSGKTTLIQALSKMGYLTVPEAARILIDKEIKKGNKLEEIRKDELDFQRKVLKIKVDTEEKLPKNKIVFFDRGIPDTIAYYNLYNFNPKEVMKFCKELTYRKIFLLEMLPFQKDYARIESEELAKKLHNWLKKAYLGLGYEVIDVPDVSVEDRLKIILSKID